MRNIVLNSPSRQKVRNWQFKDKSVHGVELNSTGFKTANESITEVSDEIKILLSTTKMLFSADTIVLFFST